MSTVAMSGNDTLIINNRVFTDLPDGDVGVLTFPQGLVECKTGKNGNSTFALNNLGRQADHVIKLIRASDDDKFLLSLLTGMQNNFPAFVLLQGSFTKNVGKGDGVVSADTYSLGSGAFVKLIEAKENSDGDTAQAIAEYHLKWAKAIRIIT